MHTRSNRIILLILLLTSASLNMVACKGDVDAPQSFICGTVVDANTGQPIPNATILMWDLGSFKRPKIGAGIYFTDENGRYNVSAPYVIVGHEYRIYACRGDLESLTIDYAPSFSKIEVSYSEPNVANFSLVPGSVISLEGLPYLVQFPTPSFRMTIKVVDPELRSPPMLNGSYISEYGDSTHAWFLGLNNKIVLVPADTPFLLKVNARFFIRGEGIYDWTFLIDNNTAPFSLPQGSRLTRELPRYSLKSSLRMMDDKLNEAFSVLDEAKGIGFNVFEERQSLRTAQLDIIKAETYLNLEDYTKSWTTLRDAFKEIELVLSSIGNKQLVSMTSTVYLTAILAFFSIVLASFFFDTDKKKTISSIIIYIIFLIVLYLIYPGAHLIVERNITLFLMSSTVSFTAILGFVFGLPRVWKERQVEGEVSIRSAVSIIFSMGKRQIKRKKIRGFFTIFSIIILILAFTSLTSFGTVFGIVSEEIGTNPPSDGILVKRQVQSEEGIPMFSPLGYDDPAFLFNLLKIKNVAPRLKSMPSMDPIALLTNPQSEDGVNVKLYGILGISPNNESRYTRLNETIEIGKYLSSDTDEILISTTIADMLGVDVNDYVNLEILNLKDARVLHNFTVRGIFDYDKYMELRDVNGQTFGPLRTLSDGTIRTCNATEVIIMNWQKAEELQREINAIQPEETPQLAVLSDFVFQLQDITDLKSVIRTLIFVFDYDVFVSSENSIKHYYIGFYVEAKGAIEIVVPLIMVGLNVGAVMLNAVYERRREIRVLSMLGLNPSHIAFLFIAEAIVIGVVGGGLGYLFGLGFYRIMVFFGQELMVREKLEWWWSSISFVIALTASILSAIRPAMLAIKMYTPSMVRKIKLSEEKKKTREEKIFKVYQAKELSMPVKLRLNERIFFISFFLDRLDNLKVGTIERVENVEELQEIENVRGELVKTIKFDYYLIVSGHKRGTKNQLLFIKSPSENYYRVRLVTAPASPGMPETIIDRTIDFVHDIVINWVKNRDRIIGI